MPLKDTTPQSNTRRGRKETKHKPEVTSKPLPVISKHTPNPRRPRRPQP